MTGPQSPRHNTANNNSQQSLVEPYTEDAALRAAYDLGHLTHSEDLQATDALQ